MPQKRNPISSELMLAAAKAVRQHAGLMVDAMIHDFERATGPWHAEWVAIPESFVLTAGALVYAVLAWKNRYWGIASRAYYTLVTIAAVAFVWFLNYWNLLGW